MHMQLGRRWQLSVVPDGRTVDKRVQRRTAINHNLRTESPSCSSSGVLNCGPAQAKSVFKANVLLTSHKKDNKQKQGTKTNCFAM